MGEAQTRLCPFKPLVEGSSPFALTNPQTWGLVFLSPTPAYLDVCRQVEKTHNSNVLSFLSSG